MKNFTITSLLLLALASFATTSDKFINMTPADIIAYNRTFEYWDQVYCSEKIGIHTCTMRNAAGMTLLG